VIKLRFVTLYFGEIAVIEVPGVFEINVFEDNDSPAIVPYSQVVSGLVICDAG